MNKLTTLAVALAAALALPAAHAQQAATAHTAQANKAFGAVLPLADRFDFDNASRGLLATLPGNKIVGADGKVAWDGTRFDFIKGAAPDSVNPSLWRQEQLNNMHGLFQVADGIYQLRGYDISNMTLIAGKSGWIVVDPLLTPDVARATMELAQEKLGRRPIVAVVYTHGHVDHFGGVRGIVSAEELKSGKVRIVAPEGFMESALTENVLAGNAMTRRARYQFGMELQWGERGAVGTGLGKTTSVGAPGLLPPTDLVTRNGQELDLDGVRFVFHMAQNSEAPSEFMFYLPQWKALCMSEVVNATMHNIYTLRGAKVRDSLAWSKYINELLDAFPEAETGFRSHHWPVWGKAELRTHLAHQRDMYRFIHDQALGLANAGAGMQELANESFYPKALLNDFSTHGYYGSLSHNLRGAYNFYLGFFDGNPATLNPLPRTEQGKRYVQAMGGAKAVLAQMRKAYAAGDYRWASEIGNHLVYAEPSSKEARALQADTLEQLGYQAESGVWRNEYLTAAAELRRGVAEARMQTASPELMGALPLEMIFDFLSVRLKRQGLDGINLGFNLRFTDTGEQYALELSNTVLNNTKGRVLAKPDASLELSRATLFEVLLGRQTLQQALQGGAAKLGGDPRALATLLGSVQTFDQSFPLVTPAGKP